MTRVGAFTVFKRSTAENVLTGPVANAFQVVLVGALPSGCQTQLIAEVASNVAEAIRAADENKSRDGVCARQRRAAFSDQ
jgi:hypothetical protein